MKEKKFFEIDTALTIELYHDLDAVFNNYGVNEVERMWLSMMYALEKHSYMTIKSMPYFNDFIKKSVDRSGV